LSIGRKIVLNEFVEHLDGVINTRDLAFLARYLTATSRVDLCRILASEDSLIRIGIGTAIKNGSISLRKQVQDGGCVILYANNEEQILIRPDRIEACLPETSISEILRSADLREEIAGGQSYRLQHYRKVIGVAESYQKTI